MENRYLHEYSQEIDCLSMEDHRVHAEVGFKILAHLKRKVNTHEKLNHHLPPLLSIIYYHKSAMIEPKGKPDTLRKGEPDALVGSETL